MNRTVCQFVIVCTTLAALGSVSMTLPAYAAGAVKTSGSVAGVVLDATGTPQIGAVVELLRSDTSLAARVFTDRKGFYSIATVVPGKYALKAMGSSFIPTLKQNLRIRANTVVNLTLNTLYDLMQWTPQPHRTQPSTEDDWAWTLRSAESRPLLRWLEDGSPILISDGAAETRTPALSRRRMRILVSAGECRFGAGSEQVSVNMQQDLSTQRRMALSSRNSVGSSGYKGAAEVMEAMLGFRQELGTAAYGSRSMQTLAAVMVDSEVGQAGGAGQQGIQAAALRSWESLQVMDALEAEAGSNQVFARLGDGSGAGSTVVSALPFGSLKLNRGASSLEYRVATSRSADSGASESMPEAWLPVLSERDGELVMEHGLHQELGWSTSAGPAEMQVVIYDDSIQNPLLEASGRLTTGSDAEQWMLLDGASGILRAAGPNYSTAGLLASLESRLPGGNRVRLAYASGDAVVMDAALTPEDLGMILKRAHARHAQMYSLAMSGTVDGAGTRWRASYRWQPQSTVTAVAPFAVNASEPYLNVYIRQPLRGNRQGQGGVEALLDLRNLLAEGYAPYLTSDGSHLYFAQAQRSIRGGLAFTF